MAAAVSYYALFSLFPLLIVLISLTGTFLKNTDLQQRVVQAVIQRIPALDPQNEDVVAEAIHQIAIDNSAEISFLGIVGMIWGASGVFGAIRTAVNTAYEVQCPRPFFHQKLIDFAMVPGSGLLFLVSIGSTAFVGMLRQATGKWTNSLQVPLLGAFIGQTGLIWGLVSYLMPFLLTFIAIYMIYWIIPATRLGFKSLFPSVLFTAVMFEVAKVSFVFYSHNFARYDAVYGSLSAVAAFLFWVYLSAMVLLFGAEVASEYSRVLLAKQKEKSKDVLEANAGSDRSPGKYK